MSRTPGIPKPLDSGIRKMRYLVDLTHISESIDSTTILKSQPRYFPDLAPLVVFPDCVNAHPVDRCCIPFVDLSPSTELVQESFILRKPGRHPRFYLRQVCCNKPCPWLCNQHSEEELRD